MKFDLLTIFLIIGVATRVQSFILKDNMLYPDRLFNISIENQTIRIEYDSSYSDDPVPQIYSATIFNTTVELNELPLTAVTKVGNAGKKLREINLNLARNGRCARYLDKVNVICTFLIRIARRGVRANYPINLVQVRSNSGWTFHPSSLISASGEYLLVGQFSQMSELSKNFVTNDH